MNGLGLNAKLVYMEEAEFRRQWPTTAAILRIKPDHAVAIFTLEDGTRHACPIMFCIDPLPVEERPPLPNDPQDLLAKVEA